MTGRRLLVLQDSPDFGGHEAMFLRFLPALAEGDRFARIAIRYCADNDMLRQKLAAFDAPPFDVAPWPFAKRRGEPYLARFRRDYVHAVQALIEVEAPDVLLLLQGRIENLAVPILAAPAETFLVSYVPMAHRMGVMGRSGFPGDLVRRRLYARPDRFIVPSQAVADQIRTAGGRAEAIVVDNVCDPPPARDRDAARRTLGIAPARKVALILGRLEEKQKGLDLLGQALRRDADALGDWTLLVVGDGPARPLVARLAAEIGGRVDIRIEGWSPDPHLYLAAADLLLMPSRWEGVPLVLLDAMGHGLPVLGSQIDIFAEYLPASCRCDFAAAPLHGAMDRAISPAARADFRDVASARLAGNGLDRARARFAEALRRPE